MQKQKSNIKIVLASCLFASIYSIHFAYAERDDKVTVCHIPGGDGKPHEISIDESAVQAHLNHGDTLGSCDGYVDAANPEPSDNDNGAGDANDSGAASDNGAGDANDSGATSDNGEQASEEQVSGESGAEGEGTVLQANADEESSENIISDLVADEGSAKSDGSDANALKSDEGLNGSDGNSDNNNAVVLANNRGGGNKKYLMADSDNDGIGDELDNCVYIPNSGQDDMNANGVGDVCETLAHITSLQGSNGLAMAGLAEGCGQSTKGPSQTVLMTLFLAMLFCLHRKIGRRQNNSDTF